MSNGGAATRAVKAAFKTRQAVFCEYCGCQVFRDLPETADARATGDHRVPISRGGAKGQHNIAITCLACNKAKGPLTEWEFRAVMYDPRLRRKLHQQTLSEVDPNRMKYPNHKVKVEAKRERRVERLTSRIKLPEPDCPICGGTGLTDHGRHGQRHQRPHRCPCAFDGIDSDRLASIARELGVA